MMDPYEYSEIVHSQRSKELNAMSEMNSITNRDAVPSPVCFICILFLNCFWVVIYTI